VFARPTIPKPFSVFLIVFTKGWIDLLIHYERIPGAVAMWTECPKISQYFEPTIYDEKANKPAETHKASSVAERSPCRHKRFEKIQIELQSLILSN
jgi:hypothetical protein